jgi:RHS repeat-associated protein
VNVPTDIIIALRISKPLKAETVNTDSVTLSGPGGIEKIKVVAAENGRLVFVTPETDLLPGTTYNVTLNGSTDLNSFLLPICGISFTTEQPAGREQPSSTGGLQVTASPDDFRAGSDDESEWRGQLRDGKPHSNWEDLPPLQAAPGITALAGQVLDLRGAPLARVSLQIESHYGGTSRTVQTDETGRFLLKNIEAGWGELIIDGREARRRRNDDSSDLGPKEDHGLFEYGLKIKEGETNVLPFTIWLPKIDTLNAKKIASPTPSEVIITSPKIPGLELRIPAGTTIKDRKGEIVNEVSLTKIPLDRTPFPLPDGVTPPVYFTAQPGGAYLHSTGNIGARIHYPNTADLLPGTRLEFWHYSPGYKGWYSYGTGTVPESGKQIIPDTGISIYEFTGAMAGNLGHRPAEGPPPCPHKDKSLCETADPVIMANGLFVMSKTDLYLPDALMPISFTRTYRPRDTFSRAFGIGASHNYDLFVAGNVNPATFVDLIMPDGERVHYDRTSPGTALSGAVYQNTTSPSRFFKSTLTYTGQFELKLKDGTVYIFKGQANTTRPGQTGLLSIRDRNGNTTLIIRDSLGNVNRITSPNNRWIEFTYDASNRITQARDNIGRTVNYAYDATGRLINVTDPNSGVTEYTYDASSRMLTIKDARQIVFLTNEYDATGKVIKQTQADGGIYLFSYTMNGSSVVQTDVTNPRGYVSRVTFSPTGQILTHTEALGTAEEQVTTFTVQSGSDFPLTEIDPLGRTTSKTYDSMGNVTDVTRLFGTPDAVTTSFTYDPTFNQLLTATDPLNHTTTFGYDSKGNLTSVTNPLNQTTTISRNFLGQPVSSTDPLNNTTQFTYEFGDFASISDPLGNVTSRLTDAAGRVVNGTTPSGNPTIYNYDVLNRLTQVNDSLNGTTGFGYDSNGNLLNVTDARSNTTTYTYENMDRLATRTDPLMRSESYQYDLAGNMSQFTDRKSQASTYSYDGINRRTGVTYADSSTMAYTYDKGNRLTQVVDSLAGTITRTYDGLNRLTSETTPQGSVSYTYDAANRRASMTVFGQTAVNYTYDNANRLTQITQGSSTVSYTYDNAGRRTSLTLPNGVLVEYAYDAASRLTSITYKQNGTTVLGDLTYEYDKNGNRTKLGGSFARTGISQAIASTAYNAANHQTTFGDKTLTYDNNGNLQTITDSTGTTTYTWNARNQLTGISGPGASASFVYDGLGRREKKTVNSSLTEFLFDGLNPVQETSGSTVLANVLPGLGIDEFLTRTEVSSGTTSFFLADALGSPVAVTDSAGTMQTEYTYEPFGKTTSTGAANSSAYQYTGRENDGTGLYYYRARYYHPQLQRFISEDPIGFASGELNFYSYVMNNPMLYIDPLGLVPGACRDPKADCGPPDKSPWDPPPQNSKSLPPPPIPPEPPLPPVCQGCYTDRGKVYDENGDPVRMDPPQEGLRGFGDAMKTIIRELFRRGRPADPDA